MARSRRSRLKLLSVRLSRRDVLDPSTLHGRMNAVSRDRDEFNARRPRRLRRLLLDHPPALASHSPPVGASSPPRPSPEAPKEAGAGGPSP